MAVEESFDAGEEMEPCFAAVDAVVAVGVDLLFELDACLYHLLGELGGVLEVDVVVGKAVADEQVAVQLPEAVEGRDVVAVGVLLGRTHVAFGVG